MKGRNSLSVLVIALVLAFPDRIASREVFAVEPALPEQIILTWQDEPSTSQTITWLMPDNLPAGIQYGKAAEFNGSYDTFSKVTLGGTAFDSTHNRYSVDLTGLTPDTKYLYRVGREGSWSGLLSFTTAAYTTDFSFLYMGDVQAGYPEWGAVLNSVYRDNPKIRFAMLGGDLTDNGNDELEWGRFAAAASPVFSRIPVMPAMGNHDGSMFMNYFSLPDNGPEGLEGLAFYSFDYGNAHFVVLNSSYNTLDSGKQWLQQDLQQTTKKWKFITFHIPAYPATIDYKGIDQSIQANWVPILEQYEVDMVFVGHQHEYMRTYPIFQGNVQSDASSGIIYVMGNAGAKMYAGGGGFPYIAREQTGSNYEVIDINDNVLTFTAKQTSGQLIEKFSIYKTVPATSPVYQVIPETSNSYNLDQTTDGIKVMTVNPGVNGLIYFNVRINPVIPHPGEETVLFSHRRNGCQLELNAAKADFDVVGSAQAGFVVQPGDEVRVYPVDDLTNATDVNPQIFQ